MYIKAEYLQPEGFFFPPSALNYLEINVLCELQPVEIKAISDAITAFENQLAVDPPPIWPPRRSTVIITGSEELVIGFDDIPEILGQVTRLVILHPYRWRKSFPGKVYRVGLTAVLEELCHMHYLISDELEVKRKVHQCYRHIDPFVRYEDLYDPHWQP